MTEHQAFRLVAPEFNSVKEEELDNWFILTRPLVGKKAFGELYAQALAYLTAHRMKMMGLGTNENGTVADSIRIGNYSEGETSVGFSVNQGTNLLSDGELTLTQYGLSYLSLRRMVSTAIITH